jgi:hypothetical protein
MKRAIAVFIFVWISISAGAAWAACDPSANTTFVSRAIRFKSVQEIAHLKEKFCQMAQNRRICEVQTREGLIPTACFSALEKEAEEGLISPEGAADERRRLSDLCSRLALKSKDRTDLKEAGRVAPEACAQMARERLLDLEYANGTDQVRRPDTWTKN